LHGDRSVEGARLLRAIVPEAIAKDFESNELRGGFLCGLATAAAARGRLSGGLADQFRGPDGRDEPLDAVIIEIDCGTFGVRFGDDSHAVLLVPNRLPFN
jgi:hypothetical protein